MTKDEAIKEFRDNIDKHKKWAMFEYCYEEFLCEIYDDFESRTCENCKWKLDEYCIEFDDFRAIAILDGQGCGKFERRSK